ncbi:unnamed protein product [Polarella glacialis]|uniref:Uncharacterized protein n=1 Tax=Polarella glacialis TaxID=89957 RepID=A0A813EB47_POLGL|nr:unnamed protein product [Polarella glacialis]
MAAPDVQMQPEPVPAEAVQAQAEQAPQEPPEQIQFPFEAPVFTGEEPPQQPVQMPAVVSQQVSAPGAPQPSNVVFYPRPIQGYAEPSEQNPVYSYGPAATYGGYSSSPAPGGGTYSSGGTGPAYGNATYVYTTVIEKQQPPVQPLKRQVLQTQEPFEEQSGETQEQQLVEEQVGETQEQRAQGMPPGAPSTGAGPTTSPAMMQPQAFTSAASQQLPGSVPAPAGTSAPYYCTDPSCPDAVHAGPQTGAPAPQQFVFSQATPTQTLPTQEQRPGETQEQQPKEGQVGETQGQSSWLGSFFRPASQGMPPLAPSTGAGPTTSPAMMQPQAFTSAASQQLPGSVPAPTGTPYYYTAPPSGTSAAYAGPQYGAPAPQQFVFSPAMPTQTLPTQEQRPGETQEQQPKEGQGGETQQQSSWLGSFLQPVSQGMPPMAPSTGAGPTTSPAMLQPQAFTSAASQQLPGSVPAPAGTPYYYTAPPSGTSAAYAGPQYGAPAPQQFVFSPAMPTQTLPTQEQRPGETQEQQPKEGQGGETQQQSSWLGSFLQPVSQGMPPMVPSTGAGPTTSPAMTQPQAFTSAASQQLPGSVPAPAGTPYYYTAPPSGTSAAYAGPQSGAPAPQQFVFSQATPTQTLPTQEQQPKETQEQQPKEGQVGETQQQSSWLGSFFQPASQGMPPMAPSTGEGPTTSPAMMQPQAFTSAASQQLPGSVPAPTGTSAPYYCTDPSCPYPGCAGTQSGAPAPQQFVFSLATPTQTLPTQEQPPEETQEQQPKEVQVGQNQQQSSWLGSFFQPASQGMLPMAPSTGEGPTTSPAMMQPQAFTSAASQQLPGSVPAPTGTSAPYYYTAPPSGTSAAYAGPQSGAPAPQQFVFSPAMPTQTLPTQEQPPEETQEQQPKEVQVGQNQQQSSWLGSFFQPASQGMPPMAPSTGEGPTTSPAMMQPQAFTSAASQQLPGSVPAPTGTSAPYYYTAPPSGTSAAYAGPQSGAPAPQQFVFSPATPTQTLATQEQQPKEGQVGETQEQLGQEQHQQQAPPQPEQSQVWATAPAAPSMGPRPTTSSMMQPQQFSVSPQQVMPGPSGPALRVPC